jgi:hypothetical protein
MNIKYFFFANEIFRSKGSQHAIEQPYWFTLWIYPVVTPFPVTTYSAGDIAFQELGVSSMVQFVKTGWVGT